MEQWKVIPGTNNLYSANDQGDIRRNDKGNFLTPNLRETGYTRVTLCVGGKVIGQYVHILVALAFLGKRPEKHDVNHRNGIKSDNRIDNLEYLSRKQHEYHTRYVLKRQRGVVGQDHGNAVLSEHDVKQIHSAYSTGEYNMRELANRYGITISTISSILNGHNWKHLSLPKLPKRKYHLKGTANPNSKITDEMSELIQSLRKEGKSVADIVKRSGLGRTTIYRTLKKLR